MWDERLSFQTANKGETCMATKKSTPNFGEFLSNLAQSKEAASSETLAKLQEKFEQEQQAKIEDKLKKVYTRLQASVEHLRQIRLQEKKALAGIKELEEQANKIVAGTDEEENTLVEAFNKAVVQAAAAYKGDLVPLPEYYISHGR